MRYALLVALCVTFAGCSSDSGGKPLSQAEAEAVADEAVAALAADFASGGGDIRKLIADLEMSAPEFGSGDMQLTIEWGLQGTSSLTASVRSGGFTISFAMQCGTDRQVIEYGGDRFEARPTDDCQELFEEDASLGEGLDFANLDDLDRLNVTPLSDGRVRATYNAEGTTMTLIIDRSGKVTRMELDGPDVSGTVDIERGQRRLIDPAPASDRMPTSASVWCMYWGGQCESEVTDGDDAPLGEFEVRIYASGSDPSQDTALAIIPLAGGSANGYTVSYMDDGDGKFGEGDSLTVTGPDEDVDVIIWDLWADKDIDDVGLPGPSIALLALALLALAVQRRAGKP